MGWYYKEDNAHLAAKWAAKWADKKAVLPLLVRSYTPAGHKAMLRRRQLWLWAIYWSMTGGMMLSVGLDSGTVARQMLIFVTPVALAGAALIALGMRWRAKRDGDYRDPELAVEVGADGIIVSNKDGAYGQRWHEIDAQVNWSSLRQGLIFHGLWLQSPLGLVDLRDETYGKGRIAAAAIARGILAAHEEQVRKEIERIG